MESQSPNFDRMAENVESSGFNAPDAALLQGVNGYQSYFSVSCPASPRDGISSPRSAPVSPRVNEWRNQLETNSPRFARNSISSDSSTTSLHHAGHKFHEMFQLKQGRYSDLPAAKISEMLKSATLDIAPTQSLLSVINGILDESMDKKNGEIPYRVACLLRKVVQEIERRISTQADHIRNQNNLIKTRDERYQSRIRLLETLTNGTSEEAQILMNQLQQIKIEKIKVEESKKLEEENLVKLTKEKENSDLIILELKKELEATKMLYAEHSQKIEGEAIETRKKMEERVRAVEKLLTVSTKKIKELEASSESMAECWNKKEHSYKKLVDLQSHTLKELRMVSESITKEILVAKTTWQHEFDEFGKNLKELAEAAQNYHVVLAENRKLYNEVQDLRGNIRVYCRIRPFLPGQNEKNTTIEYISEEGELLITNPSKKGKEGHRMFKFDKVFGPRTSQGEVFSDTRPLIRSVLDGYNVCIFAYGQTGSGKTYTMSGPEGASEEAWGVNYRALNDLFSISRSRRSTYIYEVAVQMVEIYNEQVRDLLLDGGAQRRLGIWSTSQPNGLAVPEANMYPVNSTEDVLELMRIGQMNRAVGATALNLRSSRSHSILTVHVRGTDLETGAALRGSLNLVDLAGSERVHRSEATGDRLKEAQYINKSLSALGDVIFALSQKNAHVPYRNSKLTQVLQSSLGGQAKTLMLVQLNPDVESYSETISTLKFAERVSGVELGAARSNKEGKDVRELMEQVSTLKDIIAKKDNEIEQLLLFKDVRTASPNILPSRYGKESMRHASSSPSLPSVGTSNPTGRVSRARDMDGGSEYDDKHSEGSSQQSIDDIKPEKEILGQSHLIKGDSSPNVAADIDLLGHDDAESAGRLSDISDGSISVGAETDSVCSVVDFTPNGNRSEQHTDQRKTLSSCSQAQHEARKTASSRLTFKDPLRVSTKGPLKVSTSLRKPVRKPLSGSSTKPAAKQWH